MNHSDFTIGLEFHTCTGQVWRCTDVGTRTILAIEVYAPPIPFDDGSKKRFDKDESWFVGPPYAVPEVVFDEIDIRAAYRTEEEHILEALADADENIHPGYSQEVAQTLMDNRVFGQTRAYLRKELLRFDRVNDSGEVLHPYGAEPAGDYAWLVLLYLPYTEQFTAMPESEFVRLRPATKDDLRRRSANEVKGATVQASCAVEQHSARAQDRSVESSSANGAHGFLLKAFDGPYFFRVYQDGSKENFSDFMVAHSDLEITIDDDDAYFYRSGNDLWLDYSPATLGNEGVSRK